MKTTLEIPDELFRQAKVRAALEGIPLRDLVVRGLCLAMAAPSSPASHHVEFPIIRTRPGSRPMTSEQVKAAQEQMDQEVADHDASLM